MEEIRIYTIVLGIILILINLLVSLILKGKYKPKIVTTLLVIMIFVSSIISTVSIENRLRYDLELFQSLELTHRPYQTNSNSSANYTYRNYREYYAGVYYDFSNDNVVLHVKETAPTALVEYLERNVPEYSFVKYSYLELELLEQIIFSNYLLEQNEIVDVDIDVKSNKVIIRTSNVSFYEEHFKEYIDIEMLSVVYGIERYYQIQ